MLSRVQVPAMVKWAGIGLLVLIGLIHLVEAPDQFDDATYKGMLFLANATGCTVALVSFWRNARWAWLLGAVIAAATAVGYVWSRSIGLPGLAVDPDLFEPLGVVSVLAEFLFVGLAVSALTRKPVPSQASKEPTDAITA